MYFHRLPTSILYFMIVLFIHVFSSCVWGSNEQYNNCGQPLQCGRRANYISNSNITYPFWGGNRAEYCGLPRYQLNCKDDDDAPWLTIQSTTYRVLDFNIREKTLTVATDEFWNNTCPSFLYNATIVDTTSSIFKYAPNTQNLILYYGCPPLSPEILNNQFECSVNGTTSIGYYAKPENPILGTCNNSVIVRVFRSAAEGLAIAVASNQSSSTKNTSISAALAQGFALQWTADYANCHECVGSGGQCGYNSSSSSFTCYCFDQSYPLSCGRSGSKSKCPLLNFLSHDC